MLTSTPNTKSRCFQLWRQTPTATNIPGFRKGRVPAQIAYLFDDHQKSITKLAVCNLAQDRLLFVEVKVCIQMCPNARLSVVAQLVAISLRH